MRLFLKANHFREVGEIDMGIDAKKALWRKGGERERERGRGRKGKKREERKIERN